MVLFGYNTYVHPSHIVISISGYDVHTVGLQEEWIRSPSLSHSLVLSILMGPSTAVKTLDFLLT